MEWEILILEAEALGIVGQLFLDMGHPEPAAAAFRAIISRAPADRILLPSLGGLAVAASRMGARETVAWVEDRIESRIRTGATPYCIASAQLDLAIAWNELTLLHTRRSAARRARTRSRVPVPRNRSSCGRAAGDDAPAREALSTNVEEVAAVLNLAAV